MVDAAMLQKIRSLGGEGVLTEKDIQELKDAALCVLALMADGGWHKPSEICFAAGQYKREAREGLRRLRELRRFFKVEKMRSSLGSREWLYRLQFKTATSG